MITRKAFIKQSSLAIFGIGSGIIPSYLKAAVSNINLEPKKILVCIFQRGAMDGLMAVNPYNDIHLKALRPNLFMPHGNLIDLNGKFGLHPSLKALAPFYKSKELAIVHGIGSPNTSRSHFDAQDYMESGTPFSKNTESGWLNRYLDFNESSKNPFRAISLTNSTPRSLYGENGSLALNNIQDFNFVSKSSINQKQSISDSFEDLYSQSTNELLRESSGGSFEALKALNTADLKNYKPLAGVNYPNSDLGKALKQIAQLIKMEVGLEIGFAESTGWDTHRNQGTINGNFAQNANDLGNSIAAFWEDLGVKQSEVTLMTMTEFGRTVHQNGTNGTDHGRASCSFILGHDIKGGIIFENLPELKKENLEDKRDLPVSIDYRQLFTEVALKKNDYSKSAKLFPEFNAKNFIGIKK